jgi:broad specificity phosphatase PhoE
MRSSSLNWLSLLAILVNLLGLAAPVAAASPEDTAVVFLVRHAEKTSDGEDPALTAAGRERARQLARLLADSGVGAVYSTDFKRTLDTAKPLAAAAGLRVRLYDWDALAALAAELTAMPGRRLVVGHSDTTPELVGLLGGEPGPPIDEADEYDRLYMVTVAPGGTVTTIVLRYGP